MKKTLCLFFSNDTGLRDWNNIGLLSREIDYYKNFLKKKINLIFLTFGDKRDLKIPFALKGKIKILPVYKSYKRPDNFLLRNIFNIVIPLIILGKQNFDAIKVNQLSGGLGAFIVSIILRKKIFFRVGWEPNLIYKILQTNIFRKFLYKILSSFIYNFGKNFSVSSLEIKKFVLKKILFGKHRKRIHVIENYIDTSTFRKIKKRKNKNKILLVSRLSKEKNIEFLINALKGTKIEADIIGTGKEKLNLKKYAKKNHVKINFLGKKMNHKLPHFINSYYVYVICSKIEGNVKSLLEAMSCESICIGTKVPGIKNLISNNNNGILVNNPIQLRLAIQKILKNPKKFSKLGKKARQRILRHNSSNNFFKKELKLINSI